MAKLLQEFAQLFLVRGECAQIRLVHRLSTVCGVDRREQLEGDQVATIWKPQREVCARWCGA
jgi:hypothetical protein